MKFLAYIFKKNMREKIKNLSRKKTYWLSVAIVGTVIGITIQFANAWVAPGNNPPAADVNAPVLTNGNQNVTVNNLTVSGSITLGGEARNTWGYAPGAKTFTDTSVLWTVPAGVSTVHAQIWGGGGGGAMGRLSGQNLANGATNPCKLLTTGGGGAAGGYVYVDIPVVGGEKLRIVAGKGGDGSDVGLASSGDIIYAIGGSGGLSSVSRENGTVLAKATGGRGGQDSNYFGGRSGCYGNFMAASSSLPVPQAGQGTSYVAGGQVINATDENKGSNPKYAGWENYWTGRTLLVGEYFLGRQYNLDNYLPGGEPITNSLFPVNKYGAGGDGKKWGSFAEWECNMPAGCDSEGYCWPGEMVDAGYWFSDPKFFQDYHNNYDKNWDAAISCAISTPGTLSSSIAGQNGAVILTW